MSSHEHGGHFHVQPGGCLRSRQAVQSRERERLPGVRLHAQPHVPHRLLEQLAIAFLFQLLQKIVAR
jgi:hypothetical protein